MKPFHHIIDLSIQNSKNNLNSKKYLAACKRYNSFVSGYNVPLI